MFTITGGKGFMITFQNGYTASVQWGTQNYCSERDSRQDPIKVLEEVGIWQAGTAEIAVWKGTVEERAPMLQLRMCDPIIGWVPADKVALFLAEVAAFQRPAATGLERGTVRRYDTEADLIRRIQAICEES